MKNCIAGFVITLFAAILFVSCSKDPIEDSNDSTFFSTFGGYDDDDAWSVQQTLDGGYIITGRTYSFGAGSRDVWLMKIDSKGNEIWNKTFGDTDNDCGYSVQQTSDQGYIITGSTEDSLGNEDVLLIKTDSDGIEEWNKTFGGNNSDYGSSVQQTSDDGFIIVGRTYSFGAGEYDIWLIKTDSSGNEIWKNTFGDTAWDCGYSVQQTFDGGYIITGFTSPPETWQYPDLWLIKTDSEGIEEWNKTYGNANYDAGFSVQQTTDEGYIITGSTDLNSTGFGDVWLIKTDSYGNLVWDKTFGGADYDGGYSVQQTFDGGYVITGYTNSYGAGSIDVWLIKTDPNGNEIWNRTFGGIDKDCGYTVQQTFDGGYVIAGFTESYGVGRSDVWLIKSDSFGNVE